MEKLTRILAVADGMNGGAQVLQKSVALARRFGAHIEVQLFDTTNAREIAKLHAELAYDKITLASMHRGSESLTEAILRRVLATQPDLVVKAPAGSHPISSDQECSTGQCCDHRCATPSCERSTRPPRNGSTT